MKEQNIKQPDFVWIDDQFWKLTALVRSLKDEGYNYLGIESYQQALDNIDTIKVAKFLVLDIIIPPGNREYESNENPYLGLDLLRRLRDAGVNQPVIVFTVVRELELLKQLENEPNVVGVFKKGESKTANFVTLAKSLLHP